VLVEGSELQGPSAPLYDLLRVGLAEHPDDVAVVSAEQSVTWAELERQHLALAGAYRELGLSPGSGSPR
jgi:non-ribosomal peptide synthetase component E (peptide arylation enzyme)